MSIRRMSQSKTWLNALTFFIHRLILGSTIFLPLLQEDIKIAAPNSNRCAKELDLNVYILIHCPNTDDTRQVGS